VAEEPGRGKADRKRGPKGAIKHTPGRGHAAKSQPAKKRRIGKRLKRRHQEREQQIIEEWERYESYSEELKKLLGPKARPKSRRPKNGDQGAR
jgi:hypothetical protein